MVSANAPARDPDRLRPRAWGSFAIVALGAAALYLGARRGIALGNPGFQGLCDRLARAGIAIEPRDWMCAADATRGRTLFLGASLAAGVGLAWPPVVLAATGRRVTAFLPLLPVAGGVTVSVASVSLWNGPPRISDGIAAAALDLALLAAPAAVVAYVLRRRQRPHSPELGWVGCLFATGVCAAVSAGVLFAVLPLLAWHFAAVGADPSGISISALIPAALVMGIFGALLGSDPRWWPWSLVPAAVLLSLGPSVALLSLSGYPGTSIWTPFGTVVPLFLVGVAATWWRPMSVAITAWLERSEASEFDDPPGSHDGPSSSPVPDGRRPFRRAVVPDAIAAGLLAVSVVIFIADPYPVTVAEVLPTYGGLRAAAQDLRTRTDLHRALMAMTEYRREHGTDRGFDPGSRSATAALSGMRWLPAPKTDRQIQDFPASTMAVIGVPRGLERIAAFSVSGRAYCIGRSTGGNLTFGVGDRPRTGLPAVRAWQEALANCGERPWTSTTLAPLPIDGMCDGIGLGYVLCRSVQALIAEELQEPVDVAP